MKMLPQVIDKSKWQKGVTAAMAPFRDVNTYKSKYSAKDNDKKKHIAQ